jgi:hypothetical protein
MVNEQASALIAPIPLRRRGTSLIDVQFTVSAAGRARSIRLGSRMVHAWAIGIVMEVDTNPELSELIKVTYSPKAGRPATFVTIGGEPIHHAPWARFAKHAQDDRYGYAWIPPMAGPPPADATEGRGATWPEP